VAKLHPSWLAALGDEFEQPYMAELREFLRQEQAQSQVLPRNAEIFAALDSTPLDAVRAVILGQDPYPTPGHAHGLCFSVQRGVGIPGSLQNIYAELESDLGVPRAAHGNLVAWAERGVLLLNAVLTVRARQPESHAGRGWERFTDRVVREIDARRDGVVFMLWGRKAQDKAAGVDATRHTILRAAHPSPRSADRGFFGCRHFSKCNDALRARGNDPIDWRLPL
jgi:uracil-DNA glycosylase